MGAVSGDGGSAEARVPDEAAAERFGKLSGELYSVAFYGDIEVAGRQIAEEVTHRTADEVDGSAALIRQPREARERAGLRPGQRGQQFTDEFWAFWHVVSLL